MQTDVWQGRIQAVSVGLAGILGPAGLIWLESQGIAVSGPCLALLAFGAGAMVRHLGSQNPANPLQPPAGQDR